jgi:hypothetical protein
MLKALQYYKCRMSLYVELALQMEENSEYLDAAISVLMQDKDSQMLVHKKQAKINARHQERLSGKDMR